MQLLSTKVRELISNFLLRRTRATASIRVRSDLGYDDLEQRQLLAGITFLEDVGEVVIAGTTGNDRSLVVESGSQLTVSQTGFETRQFSLSEVQQIRFIGLAGDDRFENRSSIPSFAFGQEGNDVLIGGSGADRLIGSGGNDQLFGNGGDDFILAGNGDDEVSAGAGDDRVNGVGGTNEIDGGVGDDLIFGGSGVDNITDPSGANRLIGGSGDDTISGGSGADTVHGGPGADRITGNGGDDFLFGQADDDTLIGGAGADVLNGNDGDDSLFGDEGDDRIVAGAGDDAVFAGDGNDRVNGVRGTNEIDGGDGDDVIFGGSEVDIITDPSGTNRIIGNAGDDTISGGSGVDTIHGGPGADQISGNGGDDFLFGQDGNDTLIGNAGADVLSGNDGDDIISSQFGDDRVIGGLGNDQSNYSGSSGEYLIQEIGANRFSVNDLRGPRFGGVDDVLGTELLNFSSGSGSPASFLNPTRENLTQRVVVQPIIAANSDGSNRAEFFGNSSQEIDIKNRIDQIFAQANIDVEFLPARAVNDTFINVGNGTGERSNGDLNRIVRQGDAAGLGSSDARVIDIYFVERVPAFSSVGEFVANGLAFIGRSGSAIQIGDNLVNSASGRATAASVTAHEIGHNLGLGHVQDGSNLLDAAGGSGDNLNASQISTALNSRLSQPIGQAVASSMTTPSEQTNVAATSGDFETAGLSATLADDGTVSFEEFGHDHASHDHSGHDHSSHGHDDGCQCAACCGLVM